MKLFDIVGGKVVIHADFLAIPAMKRYWETSTDKDQVNKVLSFIILCDYWDSPYVKSMNDDIREDKLKEEIKMNRSVEMNTLGYLRQETLRCLRQCVTRLIQ